MDQSYKYFAQISLINFKPSLHTEIINKPSLFQSRDSIANTVLDGRVGVLRIKLSEALPTITEPWSLLLTALWWVNFSEIGPNNWDSRLKSWCKP